MPTVFKGISASVWELSNTFSSVQADFGCYAPQRLRELSVRRKLNAMPAVFKDKSVLLVDDSIVRGTTMSQIVDMVRRAGAKKVGVRGTLTMMDDLADVMSQTIDLAPRRRQAGGRDTM